MNKELLFCAQINFENLERARPDVAEDAMYRIAKAQLDEAGDEKGLPMKTGITVGTALKLILVTGIAVAVMAWKWGDAL